MNQESLQNPFVLQCSKCNTIIADSFNLLNYKHNFLIFDSVNQEITIEKQKQISKNSFDSDCTYSELICKCKMNLGRFYHTVNRECSLFVGKYCIKRKDVKSYTLGNFITEKECGISDLCEEIEKLQKFCVYLHKKINK